MFDSILLLAHSSLVCSRMFLADISLVAMAGRAVPRLMDRPRGEEKGNATPGTSVG